MKSEGVFRNYVIRRMRADFPEHEGWRIEPIALEGEHPIYKVARARPKDTVLISATEARLLAFSDVDRMVFSRRQIDANKRSTSMSRRIVATRTIIYTPNFTMVRHPVRRQADIYNVEIRCTTWPGKNQQD